MSGLSRSARLVAIVSAIAFVLLTAACFFVSPGRLHRDPVLAPIASCSGWAADGKFTIDSNGCPNVYDASISIVDVQAADRRSVSGILRLFPVGDTGQPTANGGILTRSVSVAAEGRTGDWTIPENTIVGGQALELPLQGSAALANYPFDSYHGTWSVRVVNDVSGDPLPVVASSSNRAVDGYSIDLRRVSKAADAPSMKPVNADGWAVFAFDVARSSSYIYQSILMAALLLIGGLASLLMTVGVASGRRPPSLGALAWLATFLFALLQIRLQLPGNPPLGVKFDAIITYPIATLILTLIVVNAVLWIRRDDWDMENQPHED